MLLKNIKRKWQDWPLDGLEYRIEANEYGESQNNYWGWGRH